MVLWCWGDGGKKDELKPVKAHPFFIFASQISSSIEFFLNSLRNFALLLDKAQYCLILLLELSGAIDMQFGIVRIRQKSIC